MKKTLIKILISAIMIFGILGPLSVGVVHAEDNITKGVSCGIFSLVEITGCFVGLSSVTYSLTANVLSVSGSFFDTLLMFSLDRSMMEQDFISDAWKAVRGFANMLFILVLVVISISIILDLGKFNSRGLIRDVIIIALLVNFSLFAARIVVDVGNIVSLGFYDAIDAPIKDKPIIEKAGWVEKNISGAIMSTFNPARLIDKKSFDAWKASYVDKDVGQRSANAALILIFLIASAINIYTAYIFFKAGWIFIVRVAYLWILMVLAPLAFISYIIPPFKEHWDRWWKELFNKSFCIVVFLFLLWLTLIITGSGFFKGAFAVVEGAEPNLIRLITLVLLQTAIVYVLLGKTLSETKKMCDDGGLGDKVGGVLKMGAGLATGGTALAAGLAMRQGAGVIASRGMRQLEDQGLGGTRLGKARLQLHKGLANIKFGTKEGYQQRTEKIAGKELGYTESLKPEAQKEYIRTIGEGSKIPFTEMRVQSPVAFMLGQRAGEKVAASSLRELADAEAEVRSEEAKLRQMKGSSSPVEVSMQSSIIAGKQEKVKKIKEKIKKLKEKAKPKKDDKKKKKK